MSLMQNVLGLFNPYFNPQAQSNIQHTTAPLNPQQNPTQQSGQAAAPPRDPWAPLFQQVQTFTAQGMQPGENTFVFQGGANDPFTGITGLVNQFLSSPQFSESMGNLSGSFGIPLHGNPGDYAWGNNFESLLNRMFQQSSHQGNPPASQSAVNSLPEVSIQQEHVEGSLDCAICKEEFTLGEKVLRLPCNHMFHGGCIIRWLQMHNQCPVCRHELPTENPEYENLRRGSHNV